MLLEKLAFAPKVLAKYVGGVTKTKAGREALMGSKRFGHIDPYNELLRKGKKREFATVSRSLTAPKGKGGPEELEMALASERGFRSTPKQLGMRGRRKTVADPSLVDRIKGLTTKQKYLIGGGLAAGGVGGYALSRRNEG